MEIKTHKPTHPLVEALLECETFLDKSDSRVCVEWAMSPEQYLAILVSGGMTREEAEAQLASLEPAEPFEDCLEEELEN